MITQLQAALTRRSKGGELGADLCHLGTIDPRNLLVCLAAPTKTPQWHRSGDVASRRRSRLSPWIGEGAVPPIHCRGLSSTIQATAADEIGGMDISVGRSEDSAGSECGSNTRLESPRAAPARLRECRHGSATHKRIQSIPFFRFSNFRFQSQFFNCT